VRESAIGRREKREDKWRQKKHQPERDHESDCGVGRGNLAVREQGDDTFVRGGVRVCVKGFMKSAGDGEDVERDKQQESKRCKCPAAERGCAARDVSPPASLWMHNTHSKQVGKSHEGNSRLAAKRQHL